MNARLRRSLLIVAFALVGSSLAFAQGTKPAPKTAKPPAKSAPAPKKPAAPRGGAGATACSTAAVGRAVQDDVRECRSNHRELVVRARRPRALRARRHHPDQAARSKTRRADQSGVEDVSRDPRQRDAHRSARDAGNRSTWCRTHQHCDRRYRRTQDRVRSRGATRANRDRSAAAAWCLRSVEDAHRDRRVVHRSAEGAVPLQQRILLEQARVAKTRSRPRRPAIQSCLVSRSAIAPRSPNRTARMPSQRWSRWTSPSSRC